RRRAGERRVPPPHPALAGGTGGGAPAGDPEVQPAALRPGRQALRRPPAAAHRRRRRPQARPQEDLPRRPRRPVRPGSPHLPETAPGIAAGDGGQYTAAGVEAGVRPAHRPRRGTVVPTPQRRGADLPHHACPRPALTPASLPTPAFALLLL